MNITCCCVKQDLRWFNGPSLISISSDFTAYQKFMNQSRKDKTCYSANKNLNNASAYLSARKASLIYNYKCNSCKCICIPKTENINFL